MGKLKLLKFGLGFPELYLTSPVTQKGYGQGFQNALKNVASNKGLAYLVSPQIGQFWRVMVLLKNNYLKENQWESYKNMKNNHFRTFINMCVLDRS